MKKSFKLTFWAICVLLFSSSIVHGVTNWEPPVTLGTNATDSDGPPIIVADDSGNSAVVWSEFGEVFASYRPAGGTWETPVNLGKGVTPDVCIDQAGNVTVAFLASGTNGIVYSVYRPAGETWQSAEAVHVDVGKTFVDVDVSCTSASTQATVVWSNTSDNFIQSVSRVGLLWASAVTVPTVGAGTITANSKPSIFMLPDGNQQLAFYSDAAPAGIHYTKGTPPSMGVVVWDAPSDLGFGAAYAKFSFAMNSVGDSIIVATDGSNGLAAAQNGGSWGAPASMSLSSPTNLSVGLDQNGLATAVWRLAGTEVIQYRSTPITALDWSSPITISTGTGNVTPILDVSEDGHMIVGWRDGSKLFNTKRGEDGVFEATTALVTTNQVDLSTIATNATGQGFTAWTESAGLTIVSVTFEPIGTPSERLIKAGGKKRLINQRGIYP